MNTKLRLIIMNFLQYAVWGAWLITLGKYLAEIGLADKIGSFYATMGIGSLVMPALMGIVADRWIPAQRLLGICHAVAAIFIAAAGIFSMQAEVSYMAVYSCVFGSVMFYMPTIALSNSVAFYTLDKAGLDTIKDFPPIRVWGTVGFIVAMWCVDLLNFGMNANQLFFSSVLGVILAIYSLTLPSCPTIAEVKSTSFVDTFGLRAFALFKERKMAIFFIFSMMLGMLLQITNAFADGYIHDFGNLEEYKDAIFAKHSTILISLSQISETLCILLIPFFLKRFGIKKVMLISMVAWVLRFALLGAGNPGAGVWMFVISMLVYGVAFDFFNISGSLFVVKESSPQIRSSAQGLFMMMTNGFGAFFGSYIAQWVVDGYGWPNSWYIFAAFAALLFVVFALIFRYKHNPDEVVELSH